MTHASTAASTGTSRRRRLVAVAGYAAVATLLLASCSSSPTPAGSKAGPASASPSVPVAAFAKADADSLAVTAEQYMVAAPNGGSSAYVNAQIYNSGASPSAGGQVMILTQIGFASPGSVIPTMAAPAADLAAWTTKATGLCGPDVTTAIDAARATGPTYMEAKLAGNDTPKVWIQVWSVASAPTAEQAWAKVTSSGCVPKLDGRSGTSTTASASVAGNPALTIDFTPRNNAEIETSILAYSGNKMIAIQSTGHHPNLSDTHLAGLATAVLAR